MTKMCVNSEEYFGIDFFRTFQNAINILDDHHMGLTHCPGIFFISLQFQPLVFFLR